MDLAKMSENTDEAREYLWRHLNARYCGSQDPKDALFERSDLVYWDNGWTLDGMDPIEWCEAMTSEE